MRRGGASQKRGGEDSGCGGLGDIRENPLYTRVFSKAAAAPASRVKFEQCYLKTVEHIAWRRGEGGGGRGVSRVGYAQTEHECCRSGGKI